jgi:hypothetical protein
MRKSLDQINLSHQLSDFILLQAFEPNTLHGDHLTRVQIERTIDGTKLSTPNTIPQLLSIQHVSHHIP